MPQLLMSKDSVVAVADGLMADNVGMAPADDKVLQLIKSPFTPDDTVFPTDQADFDGYPNGTFGVGGITIASAIRGINPATNDQALFLGYPSGLTNLKVTGNTSLPQTIFGYVIINVTGNVTFGSGLFPAPIVLANVNDIINLPSPLGIDVDPSGLNGIAQDS